MREGVVHAWFLVFLILAAWAWSEDGGARVWVAFLLPFRALETLFTLLAPTLMEGSITAGRAYRAFDVLYVAIMIAGTGWIAWEVQGQVTLTKNRTYKTRSHDSER